jgi:hypothetical protein
MRRPLCQLTSIFWYRFILGTSKILGAEKKRTSLAKDTLWAHSVRQSVASFSQDHAAIYQWSYELLHVVPYNNSITAQRIVIKFCMKVVQLYACPNTHLFNFLQSLTPSWRMFKLVRWENDPPLRLVTSSSVMPSVSGNMNYISHPSHMAEERL